MALDAKTNAFSLAVIAAFVFGVGGFLGGHRVGQADVEPPAAQTLSCEEVVYLRDVVERLSAIAVAGDDVPPALAIANAETILDGALVRCEGH